MRDTFADILYNLAESAQALSLGSILIHSTSYSPVWVCCERDGEIGKYVFTFLFLSCMQIVPLPYKAFKVTGWDWDSYAKHEIHMQSDKVSRAVHNTSSLGRTIDLIVFRSTGTTEKYIQGKNCNPSDNLSVYVLNIKQWEVFRKKNYRDFSC